jgi:hypothetical protein
MLLKKTEREIKLPLFVFYGQLIDTLVALVVVDVGGNV